MAQVPYPLTAETFEEFKSQVYELIRRVYEEQIGGADLGDVFSLVGDILTLVLATSSGLTKSGNALAISPTSTGGLQVSSSGLSIKIISTGGLETSASGLGIKLDESGTGISLSSSGLKGKMADPATTVTDETTFGIEKAVGELTSYAREDHTHGSPSGITSPTQVTDFAITASKIFTKIPILEGDAWTDNSPSAGSIAWNAHTLYYNGVAYAITASNTALKYIYWVYEGTTYTKSDTNPTLTDTDFMIAVNFSGAHDLGWNSIANQMIGSAYIENSAIISAKINDLAVTEAKIGALAVTNAKINDLAVTEAKIGALAVTNAKIGNAEIGTLKIAGNAVTYAKRQDMYTGSTNLNTFDTLEPWHYKTITHNLGRTVTVQISIDGPTLSAYTKLGYGLRSNGANSFVIQIGTSWAKASDDVIVGYDYW